MHDSSDILVVGSGIGGLSAAALLAKEGFRVTVLEAAAAPGGCASSFEKGGAVFDTGATTLVGFDPGQPLHKLEKLLGETIPKRKLETPMQIHDGATTFFRFEDKAAWIAESVCVFGEETAQKTFWNKIFTLSDRAWQVSDRLTVFPPRNVTQLFELIKSARPADVTLLPSLMVSVLDFAKQCGIYNPAFEAFLDAQLMITTQSKAFDTPLLFAAPALSYTNSTNYYLDGGMIKLADFLISILEKNGGKILLRHEVKKLEKTDSGWKIDAKRKSFEARAIVASLPVWNLAKLLPEIEIGVKKNLRPDDFSSWSAFSLYGIVPDVFGKNAPLHHQILSPNLPFAVSNSFFVSLSHPEDTMRSKAGFRAMNLSMHADPSDWFGAEKMMLAQREVLKDALLERLEAVFPGILSKESVFYPATPFTWQRWVYRYNGQVGGIPQRMNRAMWNWPDANPAKGLFLAGDTVWPGQGVPAVALSGMLAARAVEKFLKNQK